MIGRLRAWWRNLAAVYDAATETPDPYAELGVRPPTK